jgi:hypothetical protein
MMRLRVNRYTLSKEQLLRLDELSSVQIILGNSADTIDYLIKFESADELAEFLEMSEPLDDISDYREILSEIYMLSKQLPKYSLRQVSQAYIYPELVSISKTLKSAISQLGAPI